MVENIQSYSSYQPVIRVDGGYIIISSMIIHPRQQQGAMFAHRKHYQVMFSVIEGIHRNLADSIWHRKPPQSHQVQKQRYTIMRNKLPRAYYDLNESFD
jgi:hypothetical protein